MISLDKGCGEDPDGSSFFAGSGPKPVPARDPGTCRGTHGKFAQSVSYGWPGAADPALEWAGNGEGTVGYRKKPVEML